MGVTVLGVARGDEEVLAADDAACFFCRICASSETGLLSVLEDCAPSLVLEDPPEE